MLSITKLPWVLPVKAMLEVAISTLACPERVLPLTPSVSSVYLYLNMRGTGGKRACEQVSTCTRHMVVLLMNCNTETNKGTSGPGPPLRLQTTTVCACPHLPFLQPLT